MNGIQIKKNIKDGFMVVMLHYTAHPKRDNDIYKKDIREGFTNDQAYRREYELDFTSLEGAKVFPEFSMEQVKRLTILENKNIDIGLDWGWKHPSCVITQFNEKDQWLWHRVFIGKEMQTTTFLDVVCYLLGKLPIEVLGEPAIEYININKLDSWIEYPSTGNGYRFREYCDIAGTAKSDKGVASNIYIASQPPYNMRLRSKKVGLEASINMMAMRMRKRTDGEYGILIDDRCIPIIQGLSGGFVRDTHGNIPDTYYTHAFDAARYIQINNSSERIEQNIYSGKTETWDKFIKSKPKPLYATI